MSKQSTNKSASRKEVWVPVVGFEGYYEVSNKGRVKSLPKTIVRRDGKPYPCKGKMLKPMLHSKIGHLIVALYDGDPTKRKSSLFRKTVHRIVLEAFIGPCPEGMQCRHLNGVAGDNRLENLCWGTASEDREDQRRHGTLQIGSKNKRAILTEKDVMEIRRLRKQGVKLKVIAQEYDTSESNVSSIARGKYWKWLK